MAIFVFLIFVAFCGVILFSFYKDFKDKKLKDFKDKKLLETVTMKNRGTWSERNLVLLLLKHGISAESIFHDLYLQLDDGKYSQIDLAVVTDIGIIVFEVKEYSGWIYGTGTQGQWTQVFNYGKQKYSFYNPIIQNNNHIKKLKQCIRNFENVPIFNIIVFYGNCNLTNISNIPQNVFLGGSKGALSYLDNILEKKIPVRYYNKDRLIKFLNTSKMNGSDIFIQNQHIANIEKMFGQYRKLY